MTNEVQAALDELENEGIIERNGEMNCRTHQADHLGNE
jgi:hypothetical protein